MAREEPVKHPPIRILVVGQVPPPVHGQSIMIEHMLGCDFDGVELHHVSLDFSSSIEQVGVFKPVKVLRLFSVIRRIVTQRRRTGATVLYYPPAGPHWVPVIRDLIILLSTRRRFDRTIFHFHAGGLSTMKHRFVGPLGLLWRNAYARPDIAIQISSRAPADGVAVAPRELVVVPNGIPDPLIDLRGSQTLPGSTATPSDGPQKQHPKGLRLLSVGLQSEEKGTMLLLEACRSLLAAGVDFHLSLVGSFESPEFRADVDRFIDAGGLSERVSLRGELVDGEKWRAYQDAEVFCFPTQHVGETFGLVLLEALAFSLPVVASRWSAVPEVAPDRECSLLFDRGDVAGFAANLKKLAEDPELRARLGANGRSRFLANYTIEHHRDALQRVFDLLRPGEAAASLAASGPRGPSRHGPARR